MSTLQFPQSNLFQTIRCIETNLQRITLYNKFQYNGVTVKINSEYIDRIFKLAIENNLLSCELDDLSFWLPYYKYNVKKAMQLKSINLCQCLKNLKCLSYNMDIESEKYAEVFQFIDFLINELKNMIIDQLPDYENASWT